MPVTVRIKKNLLRLDVRRLSQPLVPLIIGKIQERVRAGKDIFDHAFRGYSAGYKKTLSEMGEDPRVDLRLTGGLLNSLRLLRTTQSQDRVTLTIGVGTGTSAQVASPRRLKSGKRPKTLRARRTGRRSPAHNILGAYLHKGTPKMPARPWLGLSPSQQRWLRTDRQRHAVG